MPFPLSTLFTPAVLAPTPEASPTFQPERTAVEAVLARESDAWARGDAEAFGGVAREDVVFTNILGMFSVGREPFVAQHARIFATIYKDSRMTQTVAHVAFVRPDVAIVDTVAELRDFKEPPPGVTPIDGAVRTRLEQVMVREGGAWRVASFHNVVVSPVALQGGPPPGAR